MIKTPRYPQDLRGIHCHVVIGQQVMLAAGVGQLVGQRRPICDRNEPVEHPVDVEAPATAVNEQRGLGQADGESELLERLEGFLGAIIRPRLDVDVEPERLQGDGVGRRAQGPVADPAALVGLGCARVLLVREAEEQIPVLGDGPAGVTRRLTSVARRTRRPWD